MEKTRLRAFMHEPYARAAEAFLKLGRYDEAHEVVEAARAHATDTGEYFFFPEVLRIYANLLVQTDSSEQNASEAYEMALQTSREMNAGLLTLRIAVDYVNYQRKNSIETPALAELLQSSMEALNCPASLPDYLVAGSLLSEL